MRAPSLSVEEWFPQEDSAEAPRSSFAQPSGTTAFLAVDRSRPLHAHVASDKVASRRVLEKCGFRVIATERDVAEARSAEIEELVLRLDELVPTKPSVVLEPADREAANRP
jgi:hypothetical protein